MSKIKKLNMIMTVQTAKMKEAMEKIKIEELKLVLITKYW